MRYLSEMSHCCISIGLGMALWVAGANACCGVT